MTKDELLSQLREMIHEPCDEERNHVRADELLLMFIDDLEVSEAFYAIRKWYD